MKLRLRELRKQQNVSQVQLAEAIGSNQQSITEWELEKKDPRAEILPKLADYFGVSIDYLMYRTDCPYLVKSSRLVNGELICFTTEKLSGDEPEEPVESDVTSVFDESVIQLNRSELELLVGSLVRKALSDAK